MALAKKCSRCGVKKSTRHFYRAGASRGGLRNPCKECIAKRAKEAKTPEWRKKRYAWEKEYRRKNPHKVINKQLKGYYGITIEDYESMLSNQNGVCAVCSDKCKTGRRLVVDHNHDTGEVRGLLCQRCNQGIGLLGDSPDLCERAARYLREKGHEGMPTCPCGTEMDLAN